MRKMRLAVARTWSSSTLMAAAAFTAAALCLSTGALGASADSAARDRATTDLPDDISGPQVHFMYVVPADGVDEQLDTNGAMEESIARIERWFVKQAGNQGLRVDTYNGVPDITFVRMRRTDAQATATNPWPLWVMGEDLVAAGFNDQAKVYAAFYGGHSTWACGGATSPALPKLGAMYLEAQPTGGYGPCKNAPGFGTGIDRPGYFEIGLLHEILHVSGFTPPCAPHASNDIWRSHVNDSPTDVMYGPDAAHPAGWDWANAVLDFNRDDYYRANVPGCYDLSNSPILAPLHSVSVSVSGPGTVTSTPAGIDCPGSCAGMFPRSVTLTPEPFEGAAFRGWTGACGGTATCVVTGEASATATFASLSHRRTLTLRLRARRAAGTLGVADGFAGCRERAPVLIERRAKRGWSIVRRARTDGAGLFAAALPKGQATYRARAPETAVNGERCVAAVSRVVKGGVPL